MNKLYYFDYMATTPIDPLVLNSMVSAMQDPLMQAAPTSQHLYGQAVAKRQYQCAETIAHCLDADPNGIIFTSCATESIHTVIQGVMASYPFSGQEIITWAHEHQATLDAVAKARKLGAQIKLLPVQPSGLIDLTAFEKQLSQKTLLVSLSLVNSEIGTIQPVQEIIKLCQKNGALVHIDASQAIGKTRLSFNDIGCDYMSISGHKIYGPRGIGAIIRKTKPLRQITPLFANHTQTKNMRSGTMPIASIIGLSESCRLSHEQFDARLTHVKKCQKLLVEALTPSVKFHGDMINRVPHNLFFDSYLTTENLNKLKQHFIFSQASACTDTSLTQSHVLKACQVPQDIGKRSIRLSLSHLTTTDEITAFIEAFKMLSQKK